MARGFGVIGFLIYLIIGLYFLNFPFGWVTMPEFIKGIEKWIIFAGGILVIIGGVKYLFSSRRETTSV